MRYAAILADPPWNWKAWSKKGTGRSASSHYDVLDQAGLIALGPQIRELAADDCALFLWSIWSMQPQAHEVIEAWGFRLINCAFLWAKRTETDRTWDFGMGYWTRQQTEPCLFATRGKFGKSKCLHHDVRQLIFAPKRQHSQKPDEIYPRIERLVGGPYVELFARKSRPGWDTALSPEAGLFDNGPVKTRRQPSDLTKAKSSALAQKRHGLPGQLDFGFKDDR
jgi:N6-adenosine-specific RNA methylase IME4